MPSAVVMNCQRSASTLGCSAAGQGKGVDLSEHGLG